MEINLLTVGEMAKFNNISAQTLRFYEKSGLIIPDYINDETGYRYYSIKQSAKLDMIQHMKSLGMTLTQIKDQLDKKDLNIIETMLLEEKQNIERKIQELRIVKSAVSREIENLKRYKTAPLEGEVVLEYIPKRYLYRYESKINFYDYGLEAYEYMLRELKNDILLHSLPTVYFCNVGSILRQCNLEHKKYISTEVFVFVDEEFKKKQAVETIEANTYLCIYADSFHKEIPYAEKLITSIEEKGYKIVGDYLCEVVVELPVFHKNERNMFIKLQVPVALNSK